MASMKIDALVLGGIHKNPEHRLGHPTKCMAQYEGRVSLDRVLDGVVESALVKSVVVIGPEEIRPLVEKWSSDAKPVSWVDDPPGYSMFQNLVHAYRHLLRVSASSQDREIFFTCSDIPFLTAEIVTDYISRYAGSQYAAVVPLVTLASCRRVETALGVEIPSVEDHLPIALDGELYHLGNLGLLQPALISGYWLEALRLSRRARGVASGARAMTDPRRLQLLWHLFAGFTRQNRGKGAHRFLRFIRQLLHWIAASHYFKEGKEHKAREHAGYVDSQFLFREFFPDFGLEANLVVYDRPEVFLDFDTLSDVEFLNDRYGLMKRYFDSEAVSGTDEESG